MRLPFIALMVFGVGLLAAAQPAMRTPSPRVPTYTSDGRLLPPFGYREWVYLTSGLDMSYTPRTAEMENMSMFDNVFVNPEAYQSFQKTGTWPEKTMLVLESRGAESSTSINKSGHSQGGMMGLEVHLKDASHGGWAFYSFDEDGPAKMIPKQANCYSCHQEHAAVDTTFVQFYPTLLPLAKKMNTLSDSYVKEAAKAH